jgi:hypothetical protein
VRGRPTEAEVTRRNRLDDVQPALAQLNSESVEAVSGTAARVPSAPAMAERMAMAR